MTSTETLPIRLRSDTPDETEEARIALDHISRAIGLSRDEVTSAALELVKRDIPIRPDFFPPTMERYRVEHLSVAIEPCPYDGNTWSIEGSITFTPEKSPRRREVRILDPVLSLTILAKNATTSLELFEYSESLEGALPQAHVPLPLTALIQEASLDVVSRFLENSIFGRTTILHTQEFVVRWLRPEIERMLTYLFRYEGLVSTWREPLIECEIRRNESYRIPPFLEDELFRFLDGAKASVDLDEVLYTVHARMRGREFALPASTRGRLPYLTSVTSSKRPYYEFTGDITEPKTFAWDGGFKK